MAQNANDRVVPCRRGTDSAAGGRLPAFVGLPPAFVGLSPAFVGLSPAFVGLPRLRGIQCSRGFPNLQTATQPSVRAPKDSGRTKKRVIGYRSADSLVRAFRSEVLADKAVRAPRCGSEPPLIKFPLPGVWRGADEPNLETTNESMSMAENLGVVGESASRTGALHKLAHVPRTVCIAKRPGVRLFLGCRFR
jgi:hypothetical protein